MATQQTGLELQPDSSYLDPEPQPEENLGAAASVPWVAVALAVHAVMLMVAWFIIPGAVERPPEMITSVVSQQLPEPPPPVQQPEVQHEFPDERDVENEPVEDQRLEPEDDTHAEDPTDKPNNDIAENPHEDRKESPHPNRDNDSSAVGLAGGISGGGGTGGDGGYLKKRPRAGKNGDPIKNEKHIEAALEWLRDHQNREGYWSATTFSQDSSRVGARQTYNIEFVDVGRPDGDKGWDATCDVGLTGLAMLAFTGVGYDHTHSKYASTLRQAINFLRKVQDNDGCFGAKDDDHFAYNHAICTMAVAELYGLSGTPLLRPIVQRAVDFILLMQNPGMGWRYGVQPGDNDSSVTGWMVLTLHTAELAGIHFDKQKCYSGAVDWFEAVTVGEKGYLKTGYETPGGNNARLRSAGDVYDHNPSMDAIYVMSMLFMNARDSGDRDIRDLARVCTEKGFLPAWEHSKIDYYYWYYASLALYQVGGNLWDQWEKAMVSTLLDSQRGFHKLDRDAGLTVKEALDEHGSWDSVDAWGAAGSRVYATAINALTLQTYYRHERMTAK
jgi:hypothetical protein